MSVVLTQRVLLSGGWAEGDCPALGCQLMDFSVRVGGDSDENVAEI